MNENSRGLDENERDDFVQRVSRLMEDFRCPVCRARQPLQNSCRRCSADLSLVVTVRNRIGFVLSQLKQSLKTSPQYRHFLNELQVLARRN